MAAAFPTLEKPGIIDSFIRLENASSESLLRFARKWGVFCLTRTPRSVIGRDCFEEFVFRGRVCMFRQSSGPHGRESTAFWRALATHFRATLDVAAALKLNKSPKPRDIEGILIS
jgi:hypothetical protein